MNDYPKISEGILGEQDVPKTNTELFLSLVGQYFPEAIKDGEVDFAALKEEMGEFAEIGSEHYDFTWAGKQAAKKEAQADLFGKTLRYKPEDSLNPDTTENIYIEGDNLEALKLLRRNYHGKIKMIYIDPPYNTGNDFVYHDDFSMTDEELAELSGDVVDGVRFQKNSKDSARYHTDWLNMMYPRLRVARELLTDDGVIFISIDDNEQENLKKLCDEVFGSNNFVATMIWQQGKKSSGNLIGINHEYMLVYAKDRKIVDTPETAFKQKKQGLEKIYQKYDALKAKYSDDYAMISQGMKDFFASLSENDPAYSHRLYCLVDGRGLYQSDNSAAPDKPETRSHRPLIHPITKKPTAVPAMGWRFTDKTMDELLANDYIHFGADETTVPRVKRYLREYEFEIPATVFYKPGAAASSELQKMFGGKIFDNPKDRNEIKRIIGFLTKDNDTILDFFSGSATTAHAVMQLNTEDGGHRHFIMVQYPEKTWELDKNGNEVAKNDETSKAAYKAGYRNICEIGKERIRRAAKKIHEDNPDAQFDDGFKVFEVGGTTIRWNLMDDDELTAIDKVSEDTELLDFTNGHNDTDIVYEIMLRQYGIPLSTPIEKLDSISDRTYAFADAVVVCLEPKITDELIEKLAAIEPTPAKFVLRDSAFGDNIEFKDFSFRKLSALISNHQTEEERKSRYNNYTVEFI